MPETALDVSSFSKALMLGEIHEELVFPYPIPSGEEADKVRGVPSDRSGLRVCFPGDFIEGNAFQRLTCVGDFHVELG